jgi:hypothetical protein
MQGTAVLTVVLLVCELAADAAAAGVAMERTAAAVTAVNLYRRR